MASLLTRYTAKLVGVLSCFDRIVVRGPSPAGVMPTAWHAISPVSYFLKRCRVVGLLNKCSIIHKDSLTKFGRRVLLAARKLQEFLGIPTHAGQQNA